MASKREFYIEGDKIYWYCTRCKRFKLEEDFTINNARPDNINYYCRQCMSNYKKQAPPPTLKDVQGNTKSQTIHIMNKLGFDTTQSISEQFNEMVKNKYGVDLS